MLACMASVIARCQGDMVAVLRLDVAAKAITALMQDGAPLEASALVWREPRASGYHSNRRELATIDLNLVQTIRVIITNDESATIVLKVYW